MAKTFGQLREPIMAEPERRARVDEYRRAILDALNLAELRDSKHMTQQQGDHTHAVAQTDVPRIEHQDDIYLSTLSYYVEALGGWLEVRAIFPEGAVDLMEPDPERE